MPVQKAESYQFGGVDSRSNPANFPPERSIRCINWAPQESGALRLRSGYTVPMQATSDPDGAAPIHSLIYYEQFAATAIGPQFCLYGKGTDILNFNMTAQSSSRIGTMPTGNPWGHFRSRNYIFLAEGSTVSAFGYQFGAQMWDGVNLRPGGIPTASTGATVAVAASSQGSIAPTLLSGYQLFMAWYNPITTHVGNCVPIGLRQTVAATLSAFVITGIPEPPNPEWITALGMTNDGGQESFWLVDASGNHITVANGQNQGTVSIGNVDALAQLPVRNFVSPPFDKFARVGTRIFANLQGSPYIYYSNDEADVQNANFVGDPVECWPANQATPFPTGELPTALHAEDQQGWFFSRNNLAIFSTLLLDQGANPWQGPYPGGCAGQRAFVMTPYGPYWLTGNKQLATFDPVNVGVIPVSEEYEAALLGKLADATLSQVELGYILDPNLRTDQVVIKGLDANGNDVIIVHDFCLKDARSPFGCAYQHEYVGLTPQTFAGAGYTPRQNVFDTTGRMRLWTGAEEGFIAQIEDGSNNDNGQEYDADYIDLLSVGSNRPAVPEITFQGDMNVEVSYTTDYSQTVDGFIEALLTLVPGDSSVYSATFAGGEARWIYIRIQLTSHSADGNFDLTDPPFVPMPTYGLLSMVDLKRGRERPEAR